jgi:hypothetical protein
VTAMRRDCLLFYGAVGTQSRSGPLLVELGETAIPFHIGSENRGEPTLQWSGHSS